MMHAHNTHINTHYPYYNSPHWLLQISTNGHFSFGSQFNVISEQPFPLFNEYVIAPFWQDLLTHLGNGTVYYEIHQCGNPLSLTLLERVSSFISYRENVSFQGSWMLVAHWEDFHDFNLRHLQVKKWISHKIVFIVLDISHPPQATFEAIIITDGQSSYAVFTYYCGDIDENTDGAVVGYTASLDFYDNYQYFTGSDLSCRNRPASNYVNIVYNLNPTVTAPPPSTAPRTFACIHTPICLAQNTTMPITHTPHIHTLTHTLCNVLRALVYTSNEMLLSFPKSTKAFLCACTQHHHL